MPADRALTRKASAVYAEVLLEAAHAAGVAFEVSSQLEQAQAAIRGSIELRSALLDKNLPVEARMGIVNELFAGFAPVLLATLSVMVKRGDLGLLGRVSEAYLVRAEDALDASFIDVTTAIGLDDTLREKIKEKYAAQLGRDVLLREHLDPSIIGGIVLSAHGVSIDASVVSQLENARVVLSRSQ
ncbi:MAG: F0F1 ATP synthase subunit delta [Coriobacteriales bacterium]|jgi:F-type H+-transporting ATPase subunit delta|nr:F0F1 ATP synthase subunit delta [Coriobacteriales bacterium]